MDQSEEQIDIVGDDTEMDTTKEEEEKLEETETPVYIPQVPVPMSSPLSSPASVPLTVQITPESEPSGAKKRKPQKTTKLQVSPHFPVTFMFLIHGFYVIFVLSNVLKVL